MSPSLAVAVSVLTAALASDSSFWAGLEPGPYAVGFEERLFLDYSRPFRSGEDDFARPVTAYLWYPAEPGSGDLSPLPLERYVGAEGRAAFEERLRLYGLRLPPEEIAAVLAATTGAYEAAPHARGRFPLLLFSAGITAPGYLHVTLCEYLASHGYVSVALPSLPVRHGETPDYDLRTVDAQMRDMELVIQELHDDERVDVGRIGLVAWSLGGVAQALLQMKSPSVVALVSLDAATGYAYGRRLLEESIFFQPQRANVPLFHATDSRDDTSPAPKSFRYVDEVASGPTYLLTMAGSRHAEFTAFGSVIPHAVVPRENSEDVARRYQLLCLYVRHFLAAAVHADPEARDFLSVAPTRHGFEGLVLSRKR